MLCLKRKSSREKKVAIFVLKELGLIVRQSDKFPRGSCKLQGDQISCVETELTPHPANFQATASLSFIIRNHHRTLFLTGINIPLVKGPAPGSCGFKSSLNTVTHWDQPAPPLGGWGSPTALKVECLALWLWTRKSCEVGLKRTKQASSAYLIVLAMPRKTPRMFSKLEG